MLENTNKAIIINSSINYVKIVVNTILALFTTRFSLLALGVEDFGLFSVLGSVISFIGIFNTIMLPVCNRFITVAIGRGNIIEINKQFNVNVTIFLALAILLFVFAFPIGNWYVNYHINYDGELTNALIVYNISIVGSIISTLAIPFNGLLVAKERFFVFSLVEIISHFVKFVVTWILVSHFEAKLLIYTYVMAFMTIFPAIVYWLYCKKYFPEIVRWNIVKDKALYKDVFSFSGWVAYGAVACTARNQGANIIVNTFFNTVLNTALGIANNINVYVTMFAYNVAQPMLPQITKNYAAGNIDRTNELLIMSTKFSFLLMLFVAAPFFVSGDYLLGLWLGRVPDYAVAFTIFLVVDNLVLSFNSGLSNIIFASGKIALYQIVVNTLRLLSIVVAFFILNLGYEPYALFYTYIVFSFMVVVATQLCIRYTLSYDMKILFIRSYIPSFVVLVLFVPIVFFMDAFHPILRIIIAISYLVILDLFIGLSSKERNYFINKIRK